MDKRSEDGALREGGASFDGDGGRVGRKAGTDEGSGGILGTSEGHEDSVGGILWFFLEEGGKGRGGRGLRDRQSWEEKLHKGVWFLSSYSVWREGDSRGGGRGRGDEDGGNYLHWRFSVR